MYLCSCHWEARTTVELLECSVWSLSAGSRPSTPTLTEYWPFHCTVRRRSQSATDAPDGSSVSTYTLYRVTWRGRIRRLEVAYQLLNSYTYTGRSHMSAKKQDVIKSSCHNKGRIVLNPRFCTLYIHLSSLFTITGSTTKKRKIIHQRVETTT